MGIPMLIFTEGVDISPRRVLVVDDNADAADAHGMLLLLVMRGIVELARSQRPA